MRKILLLIILSIALPVCAKKYVPGEPWPAKGYNLPCAYVELQRFPDAELYYLKIKERDDRFRFLVVEREVADSILLYTMTKTYLPKFTQRQQWLREFLEATGEHEPITKSEWTLFKPKRIYKKINGRGGLYWRRFDQGFAWDLYCEQRDLDPKTGEPKGKPSPEAQMAFINMVRAVLPVFASGADCRTLYDKVVQSGGY